MSYDPAFGDVAALIRGAVRDDHGVVADMARSVVETEHPAHIGLTVQLLAQVCAAALIADRGHEYAERVCDRIAHRATVRA